jgi:hypothetical protein
MGVFQNNLMGGAVAATAGGGDFYEHQIAHSLRNSQAQDGTLKITAGTPTSRKTFTYSWWMKRYVFDGNSTNACNPFTAGTGGGTYVFFAFTGDSAQDDTTNFNFTGGGYGDTRLITDMVFRDPAAWYHCVVRFDSTQSTASDRVRLYVNGVEPSYETATIHGAISQDEDFSFLNESGTVQSWGGISGVGTGAEGTDIQLAEVVFCDGQSYGPDSFAKTKNGVYMPIDPSGLTFGNNGYYLKFEDSSDFGNDSSGNNNDLTAANFATHDQLTDTPTFNSDSNGGKYPTYNPLNKGTYTDLSEGNLRADSNTGADASYPSGTVAFPSSGKWYYEQLIGNLTNSYPTTFLVAYGAEEPSNTRGMFWAMRYRSDTGAVEKESSGPAEAPFGTITVVTTGVASLATGDIVSWYIDMDNKKAWIAKNGSIPNSGDPVNGTNPQFSWTKNPVNGFTFGSQEYQTSFTVFNGGQDGTFAGAKTAQGNSDDTGYGNFYYDPPTGFLALCSGNMPIPDAINPAETDDDYVKKLFSATLYTGNGSSSARNIDTGVAADLVWIKRRDADSMRNMWYDSSRGVGKYMHTDTDAAEDTSGTSLSAFNSDGFQLSDNGVYLNNSSSTYVAWNWKVNGATTSTNSTGSVNVTQQVDPSGGFSISTYSGAGGTGNIGHGLSAAPTFVLVKQTNGTNDWCVYAKGAQDSGADFAYLNTNSVFQSATIFGNTEPSSTLVYLGDNNEVNHSGRNYVAYCWTNIEGYIRSGMYFGNAETGDDTSPFVYTGFKPALVIVRYIGSGESWVVLDNKRDGYNITNKNTRWNSDVAEASGSTYNIDFLSNGFKPRTSWEGLNGNNYRIVYLAMAENPFKYATAR